MHAGWWWRSWGRIARSALVADDRSADAARTLERSAQVAALVSFRRDAVAAIRAERRARWLVAALDGRELGADAPVALTGVTVLESGGGAGRALALLEGAIGDGGYLTARDDRMVVAWTDPDPEDATRRIRRLLAESLRTPHLAAVWSARELGVAGLRAAVERAMRDLDLLRVLGISGRAVSSDSLAPYHALAPGDPDTLHRFIHDLLGPVLAWDERRRTGLFDTLAGWFDHGEHRVRAAAALRIHPNTLQQRLDRIGDLLEGDVGDPEYRFRLQAAVRFERLRRDLGGPG